MLDPLEFQLDHHIADLNPRKRRDPGNAKEFIFSREVKGRLSSSRKLENLYLVAIGIRPSSMFHPESIEEMLLVHEVAQKLGMGVVIRKCGTLVYKVFLFGREKEEMALRIPDLYENMGYREFIVAQITMANLTGQFLEFPSCCVESFVKHLMEGTDQDLAAHEELRRERGPDPRAYFVERFVPCSVKCPRAIEEGGRIRDRLKTMDRELAELYLKLQIGHMEDVRLGRILREKTERDDKLSLPLQGWTRRGKKQG
ncbi:MAG: DUF483 domain-containing protein [Candidatus Thermoplasmatota archaeon]|nr:DUF483 domain-containing protein [Candidatus Thermoplasmatota archaeon]